MATEKDTPTLKQLENRISGLITRMKRFDGRYKDLEDRVDIVWDRSISQDLRIGDLEDWQEKVDDEMENG